jgi:hypothetical protein
VRTITAAIYNLYEIVRARLKRGVYKYPDPEWVKEYEAKNRGTVAPEAAYWWACCEVAEFYKLDLDAEDEAIKTAAYKALGREHGTEVNVLLGAFIEAAARSAAN